MGPNHIFFMNYIYYVHNLTNRLHSSEMFRVLQNICNAYEILGECRRYTCVHKEFCAWIFCVYLFLFIKWEYTCTLFKYKVVSHAHGEHNVGVHCIGTSMHMIYMYMSLLTQIMQ